MTDVIERLELPIHMKKLNLILSKLPKEDNLLSYTYFTLIQRFLMLENKFYDQCKEAKKQILVHLELPEIDEIEKMSIVEIRELFLELYDCNTSHVRFAIETLDSIEEIRIYLKTKPNFYKIN